MKLPKRIFEILTEKKLTLFLLITLWLSLEYIGLGPYSYIRIHDTGDSFIPRYIVFASDFFKHGVTYWFPYMGSGVDRLANDLLYPQFAVILFGIFPGWFAYQLIIVTHFFLAGYFTYRLCKDYLKLSDIVSVYAGIAFALHCNDLINFQLGFAGFPFILWSIEKIVDSNNKYRYLLIAMLGVVYSFCSSFPWTLPFTLSATLLWFAFRRKINLSFIFLFSAFALFAILSQYSTIHSLLLNSHASHRADWGLRATSEGPIGPHIYFQILLVGIKRLLSPTIILLTFIALVISRFKSRSLLYLFSFFMFCTLGASVINLITFYFKKHISFLGGFQFDRFYELAPFFSALCVASSLDLIRDRIKNWLIVNNITNKTMAYSVFTIFIAILFSLLFYKSLILKKGNIYTWLTEGNYIANYKNEAFQRVIIDKNNEPFRIATINNALHPAYANAYGIETVDGYINLYPKSYQKFWSKVIEPLTDRDIAKYYYFNHWGNRVYLFSPNEKKEEIIFDNYYRLNLLSLANTKYIVSKFPIKNNNLMPISEPVKSSKVINNTRENLEGRKSLYIYENKTCLPRYFFAKDVIIFNNSNDMLNKMGLTEINSLKNTVYIEKKYFKIALKSNNSYSSTAIKLDKYSPDRIEFSIRLDGSGVLVVSNTYSPYWKCKVNGISTEIFPAYSTFWGIFLEKTAGKVVFYYEPPYRIGKGY
jgi:hypothetical protein